MHLRWWIAGLLFLSVVINYIDRQCLSVLAPIITKELNLSPTGYATILNAFQAAYTFMYVGSGLLVDRWGTKISLTVFMSWWSIANALHAFATNAFGLGASRFLLGLGEPGNFMAGFRVISECYAKQERALVNGLLNAGSSVGAMIAPFLITWLYAQLSWRGAFVVCGALGLLWIIPWWLIYRPLLPIAQAPEEKPAGWTAYLRLPQSFGLLSARFLSDPVWWFYLFWLPKYLVEGRGFSMQDMALVAWMPYLSSDLGAMFGGWMSGHLIGRGWDTLRARRAVMLPAALVMPISIVVAFVQSSAIAIACICIVTFAHMVWKTNLSTVTNDLYPVQVIGSVSGVFAFGNGLGGLLFTALTGWLVQYSGYFWVFALMGILHPLAFLLFRGFVREPLRLASTEGSH
ncbi:MFS transporter [Bryobacter aggregatus]|uniref:MFS transporter n=1 Tax=Bryobacter aggregatus TaxID=360054 RepID=UPI0004E27E9F|nr:MFS transporter [Bryobacter aggregatus]